MTIPRITIAATAYAVPPGIESVEAVMEREKGRIDSALDPLGEHARTKAIEGLGLGRVHVCGAKQPYDLVLEATRAALDEAGVCAGDLHLIIDYSTLPGETSGYTSFAHVLSRDLGTEASVNLSFKAGGCAGLHMAIKTAVAWMAVDENIRTALLVTGDTPPEGNRSLLPVTVQGDAGSAVVLTREGSKGPVVLDVEVMTLGHLHDVIALATVKNRLQIRVDSARMENEVMPVYYLNMLQLIEKVLERARLSVGDIDHFVYSNISRRDRESFRRMLNLTAAKLPPTAMMEYGHTFASDLAINYTDLYRQGLIGPGQLILFVSAGIGFMWGVTLART
jgi:3-oxoacyl-[acyl-carrier-protein] synthase-3